MKKEMLQELVNSEAYKKSLSGLDDDSKKKIMMTVTGFLSDFADQLIVPLAKNAESKEFREAFTKKFRNMRDVNEKDVNKKKEKE